MPAAAPWGRACVPKWVARRLVAARATAASDQPGVRKRRARSHVAGTSSRDSRATLRRTRSVAQAVWSRCSCSGASSAGAGVGSVSRIVTQAVRWG